MKFKWTTPSCWRPTSTMNGFPIFCNPLPTFTNSDNNKDKSGVKAKSIMDVISINRWTCLSCSSLSLHTSSSVLDTHYHATAFVPNMKDMSSTHGSRYRWLRTNFDRIPLNFAATFNMWGQKNTIKYCANHYCTSCKFGLRIHTWPLISLNLIRRISCLLFWQDGTYCPRYFVHQRNVFSILLRFYLGLDVH